jgi:superfamily II DNA or RNA helicase
MEIIKVENNYSWLNSYNEELKVRLWKALRFKAKGCYYNPFYRAKKWDGYNDFFKKESGRFLTGLLPEVKLALKHLGIEYEIQDNRSPFEFSVQSVDENWIPGITLRDYQVDYINQTIKNKRGLICSKTGSGKTTVMIGIIKALPPKTPTLVLANKVSLVEQNYDEICKFGIEGVGKFYGNKKEPAYITCSTVQSASLLKPILPKIKVLIVDEIHEMMSKVPKQIYGQLKNCSIRIGMSATAFKFGGTDKSQKYEVKGWIGPEFLIQSSEDGKLTTKQLQEREILSNADCTFYRIDKPQLPYHVYLDAVTDGIAENDYFHDIVAKLVGKLEGRTLIIVERIEHGDRLKERIPGALWIKGEDDLKTRKEVIENLKVGDNVVAIASQGIFTSGINVFIHNLVNAAGGQAEHQVIQKFGRGLRRVADKQYLKYYDFIFEINEYLLKHSNARIKILEKEGHNVKIMDKGIEP